MRGDVIVDSKSKIFDKISEIKEHKKQIFEQKIFQTRFSTFSILVIFLVKLMASPQADSWRFEQLFWAFSRTNEKNGKNKKYEKLSL